MIEVEMTIQLWDKLWQDYRGRVAYAAIYQGMIQAAGGKIANDHIAFRSLSLKVDGVNLGIAYLDALVKRLGYEVRGEYEFSEQYLLAHHYQHPEQDRYDLPKLFISELRVEALPKTIQTEILETVATGSFFDFSQTDISLDRLELVFTRPWQPPKKSTLEKLNAVSQYGAWVLIHGYAVNHFTGYVNRHNTTVYRDLESTVLGLKKQGVPMKDHIEGSQETGLRQTATQAVLENVTVSEDHTNQLIEIPWTYAYYEIAQRNQIKVNGKQELFQGFLKAQAQNLFEMTRKPL